MSQVDDLTPPRQAARMTISLDDLDQIEAAARAASPGPWQLGRHDSETIEEAVEYVAEIVRKGSHPDIWLAFIGDHTTEGASRVVALTGNGPTSQANADYLATLHPANVLNLVAFLRAAIAGEATILRGRRMIIVKPEPPPISET